MRIFFFYFLLFSFVFLLPNYTFAQKIPINIVKIYDGDTLFINMDKNFFYLRLVGIDCYETKNINRAYKQAYTDNLTVEEVIKKGLYSKKYLEDLHKKTQIVSFKFMGQDKYKRTLGVLYFDDENINEKLLENNICKPYTYKKRENN